ncbi:MAG TPA: hypothetical protein VF015_07215 [Acidimicrobiales bacterium]
MARAGAAIVLVGALGACGASKPTSSEAASAEVAETVCTMLRDWNNDIGDRLNTTSQAITDGDDPDTANGVLADGFDDLIALTEEHRAALDELDLPDVQDRDALLAELRDGADESVALLEERRDEIDDLEPITVDRQAGALGGAFTAVEGALAVIEPEIGGFRPELRDAFTGNEGCRHVIQPYD